MRRALLAALLPAALAAQANDWLIVPGERVGPITRASTLASLREDFGAANVHEQTIVGAEGEEFPGVMIYPDTPSRRLAIIWGEGDAAGHPHHLDICYRQEQSGACQWRTAQGITFGTSLMQLERLNGHLFHLAGFGWDYGGVVLSWDGGRLEPLRTAGLGLQLDPDPATLAKPDGQKANLQVQGDHTFSSGHPAMRALNPHVSSMHCWFAK